MSSFKITLFIRKLSYWQTFWNCQKQELLSNSTVSKLTVDEVRTLQFHILPKVHKPDIPGIPLVSSVECYTSKISKFVGHFHQLHAKSLPSYINDTSDFINKINETKDLNKESWREMSNHFIPIYSNHEGMEAVKSD